MTGVQTCALPIFKETLKIIEEIVNSTVIAFNLSFDWFHICQTYTTLIQFKDKNICPVDKINDYADYEELGRFGPCLKPKSALDLLVLARRGKFQNTMARSDIRIKKIPTQLSSLLCDKLNETIILDDLLFAKRLDPSTRFQIFDIKNDVGDTITEFKDLVLKFNPSAKLKDLAKYALKVNPDKIKLFSDIELPPKSRPFELGYAPFAKASFIDSNGVIKYPTRKNWFNKWPDLGKIRLHIKHWNNNESARVYARDDVVYVKKLYDYFEKPPDGDTDSILTCMIGAVRWKGFNIDVEGIKKLKKKKLKWLDDFKESLKEQYNFNINLNSPEVVKKYIMEKMDETEKIAIQKSTARAILEAISKWKKSTICDYCNGEGCVKCANGLVVNNIKHEAAIRANNVLTYRYAKKEIEQLDKLITAGRFHASFKVIGALSGRMSGSDGLNAQGIKRTKEVRSLFPLADDDMVLSGGDFSGFEVTIADAVYNDPVLHKELKDGKSIHALLGCSLFNKEYDEIVKTKGLEGAKDLYGRAKTGVFAMLYMGEAYTLSNRVGISEEQAISGYEMFCEKYKVLASERKKYIF